MIDGLGQRLKIARMQKKLSRKQVAEIVGVTASLIGMYETDERLPSLLVFMKLASCYGISTDYLLNCEPSSKEILKIDGLTEQQVRALKLTISCFRNGNQ